MSQPQQAGREVVGGIASDIRSIAFRVERLAAGLSHQAIDGQLHQTYLDAAPSLLARARQFADQLEASPEEWAVYHSMYDDGQQPAITCWQFMTSLASGFIDSGEQAFALDIPASSLDLLVLTLDAVAWVMSDANGQTAQGHGINRQACH